MYVSPIVVILPLTYVHIATYILVHLTSLDSFKYLLFCRAENIGLH